MYAITLTSSLAVLCPVRDLSDRLSTLLAGLLTNIALKYTVLDRLPVVPYSTFTDRYMLTAGGILVS